MNELFREIYGTQHIEEYCSGVFSDSLDKVGLRKQVVDGFRMNNPSLRMFGRVRTLVLETLETEDERIAEGLGFLDSLSRDDVLVVKGSSEYAYFGELMSRLSVEKRLSGAVIDGLTRDTYYTQTIRFPIFARGYSARDIKGRGRVSAVDVPVEIGGVLFTPGDHVFGDSDCLVVVPTKPPAELKSEIARAVQDEARIKALIAAGTTVSQILTSTKAF
jgi:4-hydroxy-4-methyl-2-oxoglutarate aldolase